MQRSRRNSIFTQPTGTLDCGGCESTLLTSSQRPRRFRTADRTDCTYSDTAPITQYIGYDGCAMTGTTGTAANARYDSRDDTTGTIGRAEGQPVNTAYDSIGQEANNSTVTLYNADENTTEYYRRAPQGFSQTFTYDPLSRLVGNTLGGVANQSWNLDSQGNWSSVTTNGVTQTETANAQNQITSISGTTGTPTYDANGNMTTDQTGNTYVYNAWNQLVSVTNAAGKVIAQYTYDARGYRVTESYPLGGNGVAAGTINYIYYNTNWQAIETRTNGTANSNVASQTVWSAAYINAAVLQDTYSAGEVQPNSRIYFQQDANWDTTAIVGYNSTTGTWDVTQRYVYSPYGTITVLNADWSTPPTGTNPLVDDLYQGMALDPVTGLYYSRARNYSPSLGRWISQDPAGYVDGGNTYQFVASNPIFGVDPSGQWFLVDNVIFSVGGALVGVAAQAATDLATGQMSSWQTYTGDAVGGAVGGFTLDQSFNPELAGALSGAAGNATTQLLNMATGQQQGFNGGDLATAAATGAAFGSLGRLLPGPEIDGVTSGRNSYNSIAKQMESKAKNGTIKDMSSKTAAKAFVGKSTEDNMLGREVVDKSLGHSKGDSPPPGPTNNLKTSWNLYSNAPEPIYQQWSDGSWQQVGETGGY